ncbi:ribosomal RNA small subunit methyltransferase A [Verrucomicrobiaceae bacterium 5K15]|uniref:Ribosomal RNA small subunit methyltransferase A n=1 Tax=Oceaniferula flava TaxID=2800421 RepID=A0AAE2VEZ0_9BACT|nr:16S rRNA (adenine(1518)-N(6)/adenine(1519)-N(6))-dimethyltransferase RsmA [Oceaniferula flavus]MBK1856394.1 ribosomal RNA small subunit methyltransferase A [Oceaniferula flavus]MBM1137701.1 ribosomal RNA small subunit methyltransferase A [Oceaniferula flavus]
MNQTEIISRLNAMGVTPSKKLGQNFLVDENVARWIVDQLEVKPGDTVVEVGPGTGALTEHVVELADKVILVEFDARLAEGLKLRFADNDKVEVHHFDGARFDTRVLFKHQPVKLLGNLPYSAGGAIMRNFMKRPSPVCKAVLMLQKEFIDRIIAKPKTKAYGVLSLRMQSEWVSKPVKTIPPQAFFPRPLIDSTVMVCEPRPDDLPVYDARLFDEIIRRGFSQRRKQIKKQMPDTADWEQAAAQIGVGVTARAEEISLEQWAVLTRIYDDHPLKDNPQKGDELFDVVDEHDEVLKQETRDTVHRENLLHRAVHMFVFNKRKELFLQKRSRLKDVHPGVWDSSAAGHLNAGEDYEPTAVRELEEELGIQDAEVQEVARIAPSEQTGWEHIRLYLCRHDGAMRFPCSEVESGEWFSMDDVREWIALRPQDFASGFIECWQAFDAKMAEAE